MKIPKVYTNMNLYDEGTKMIGVGAEITLPNLEPVTETITGAGIAGEIEAIMAGHFGALNVEIPFRIAHHHAYKLLEPGQKLLVLRTAIQSSDLSSGKDVLEGQRITIGGQPKGIDLGKVAAGKPAESKVTLATTYLKVEIDGEVMIELDKYNMIYVVNGVDHLAKMRDLI